MFEPPHFMVELINILAIVVFVVAVMMLTWSLLTLLGKTSRPIQNLREEIILSSLGIVCAVALFFAVPGQKMELLIGGFVLGWTLPWIYEYWREKKWLTGAIALVPAALSAVLVVDGLVAFVT